MHYMLCDIILSVILLSVIVLGVIMLSVIMLSVIMLSVIMLSVVMVSVIMLKVAARLKQILLFSKLKVISEKKAGGVWLLLLPRGSMS